MKVIGLTGGIGSGKSTVAQFLAELGAVVISADNIGHEVFQSGTEAYRQVVAAFGKQILDSQGEIDRGKLGDIVFNDPRALARLNAIMHPQIGRAMEAQMEHHRRQGEKVVVLEIPLLLETGGTSLVDEVWVTVAPEKTVLQRLRNRSGFSREHSLARIRAQMTDEERMRQADVVIHTDCPLGELKAKVKALWERLIS